MGNIVNRVFDSSGPEGKVRGTPQQIIDKYNQLARDAQLSNDRVAFENFQQHAEHYTRMLGEAMREQEQFRQQNQGEGGRQGGEDRDFGQRDQRDQGRRDDWRGDRGDQPRFEERRNEERREPDDVIDVAEDEESGLVETPESIAEPEPAGTADSAEEPAAARAPRRRRPRKGGGEGGAPEVKPEAAE
jgi:hypothetical protein